MINILQLQSDSAGNKGWVLISQQPDMSPEESLGYIEALASDGKSYAAELITDIGNQRIAEIP